MKIVINQEDDFPREYTAAIYKYQVITGPLSYLSTENPPEINQSMLAIKRQ